MENARWRLDLIESPDTDRPVVVPLTGKNPASPPTSSVTLLARPAVIPILLFQETGSEPNEGLLRDEQSAI